MSGESWVWASLIGTAVLTITMTGSQALGWTRMSFPLMLGTAFVANRDRALALGSLLHFAGGFALGAAYAVFFGWLGWANFWVGALGGALHGALVLLVVMPVLPALHPRMASETHGPEPVRGLEPPGPLGFNYGRPTAVVTFVAHVLYGLVVGALYHA